MANSQPRDVVRAECDPGVRRRYLTVLDLAEEEERPHIKNDRIRRIMNNFRNDSEAKQLERETFILEYGPPSKTYVRQNFEKLFCGYRNPDDAQYIWHTVNSVSTDLYHLFSTTLIGAGSQGIIRIGKFSSEARKHVFLEVVAVKTVLNEPDYPHRIIAAKDEGRCMRIIEHPNFLKWYTTVQEEKTGHIHTSMEYFPGAPLSLWKVKYGGRFDVDLIRHIAWETLQGLHYMHTEGVMVHRDIALDNILMDARLRIKIIDLGAVLNKRDLYPARCVEHTRRHLMASEVLHSTAKWSPAADIWSLGLALMQLVYNGLPLVETHEGMSNHAQDARAMEGDIGDFFKKCLARRAYNRWSAAQLLEHPWFKDHSPQPL